MKTISQLTITFLLGLSSCSTWVSEDKDYISPISIDSDANSLPEPKLVTDINKKEIIAATDTLYKGDTLKIKFKMPHSKDLAITTPDDKFFVIYLFKWQKFADLDYLEIITNMTRANTLNAIINENRIIFTKTGKYEIKLFENVVAVDATPVEVEEVYYIDEVKKQLCQKPLKNTKQL
ncbi:MAG: hypothetical protein JWO44_2733 [Bacteroidetes bacterium]|nr:hypothetical protein [Bacteroidota bacterium]